MHAYLIIGSTKENREIKRQVFLTDWHVVPLDIHTLSNEPDQLSIPIDDVRSWLRTLQVLPLRSSYTVGVIQEAHLLTVASQQALLKTLEEPPPHVKIILEATDASLVLPTIQSRCTICQLTPTEHYTDEEKAIVTKTLMTCLDAHVSIGQILTTLEDVVQNKPRALQWTSIALEILNDTTLSMSLSIRTKSMRTLFQAYDDLNHNINPKLTLSHAFLSTKMLDNRKGNHV